jgi:hypothetical protein
MDFTVNCMGQDPSQEAKTTEKKNFAAFYEGRDFITVITTAQQLTLHHDQSSPHDQTQ